MQFRPSRQNFKPRPYILGGLLLCAAFSSAALTMGRLRGAVWLGQPLDLSIQVQYEETESLSSLCFDAEVFHADTRLESGKVRVSVETAVQAQTAQVRVQSSTAVDEPVVTVYLRENCLGKTTRRYVLLSDVPSDALTTVAVATLAAAPVVAAKTASEPVTSLPADEKPAVQDKSVTPRVAPVRKTAPAVPQAGRRESIKAGTATERKTAETPASQKESQAKPEKPLEPRLVRKPQLKLDPLSSLNERVVQLEEATLASHAGESDQDVRRFKKMEDSVQALLTLAAKNERSMAELRERLQKAESEKYDNVLVYGLLVLLLMALGLVVFFWRRQQERGGSSDMWRGAAETPRMAVQSVVVPSRSAATAGPVVAAAVVAAASSRSPEPAQTSSEVVTTQRRDPVSADVDLDDLIGPEFDPTLPSTSTSGEGAQAMTFPELAAVETVPDSSKEISVNSQEAVAPAPEFPVADPVHIDVSHLSLVPAETPAPVEPAAPMLDFDFSNLTKSDQPGSGPKKSE